MTDPHTKAIEDAARALQEAAASICCEPWPTTTVYLHGDPFKARAIKSNLIVRLNNAEREMREVLNDATPEPTDE